MPTTPQRRSAAIRTRLYQAIRQFFTARGYEEVETPTLVPAPGMEPHITAFEVDFKPDLGGKHRHLFLHTSPEYTMKRLLAEGYGPIFQICKVFRNGEVSPSHNPEFSMLEFYRPHADYHRIMEELEALLSELAGLALQDSGLRHTPYERLTARDAVKRNTGIDLRKFPDASSLREAVQALGLRLGNAERYEDVFLQLFLERVEQSLGIERPTFLIEYPAAMSALARIKPTDSSVAERFELYVHGIELANGFSELTDSNEQRERLLAERELRRQLGRPLYALDEKFIAAVERMPPSAGVAVGLDRLLMLLVGSTNISDVLLFPAQDFV